MERSDLLTRLNATTDNDGIAVDLGTPPQDVPADATLLCDHLRVLRVRGEESEKFLQGQLTADVREVSAGISRLAMHLNLKGRGIASMRLLPADGGHDILVPAAQAETLQQSLARYIVFSKAEIEPDPERTVLSLEGESALEVLGGLDLPVPGAADACAIAGDITIVRAGPAPRWLLVLPVARADELWPSLSEGRQTGAADHARLAEIAAGEGHVLPDTRERFLPQELNYDLIQGVSFEKGCYTGQEVVARMHHKGTVKQRLQRLSWPADAAPAPGTPLRSESDKAVGEIVQALVCDNRVEALAVLRLDHEGDCLVEGEPLEVSREEMAYQLP